jgi:hypothetical protein
MSVSAERFYYSEIDKSLGIAGSLPYLPLTLSHQSQMMNVQGLLDTGATVNVLPYQVGLSLGAEWRQQTTHVQLTGNLANFEARVLLVPATVGKIYTYTLDFCLDTGSKCSYHFRSSEFFHGV